MSTGLPLTARAGTQHPAMPNTDANTLGSGPIFSWSRDHAGLIYTSGHAAVDVDTRELHPGKVEDEARRTLENLRRTLESAGSGLAKVLKVTIYLVDMADYAAVNAVYAEFFGGASPPARTCVQVGRLPYNFKIEIEAIAST